MNNTLPDNRMTDNEYKTLIKRIDAANAEGGYFAVYRLGVADGMERAAKIAHECARGFCDGNRAYVAMQEIRKASQ